MPNNDSFPTLDAVVDAGSQAGVPIEQQAQAVLNWRDAARQIAQDSDVPTESLYRGNVALDDSVKAKLDDLRGQAVVQWGKQTFPDESDYTRFISAFKANPTAAAQANPDAAKGLTSILSNPAFQPPKNSNAYFPISLPGHPNLGTYTLQQGTNGNTDVFLAVQPPNVEQEARDESGRPIIGEPATVTTPPLVRTRISVPTVTDDDLQKARDAADEAVNQNRDELQNQDSASALGAAFGFDPAGTNKTLRIQQANLEARSNALDGPNGKAILQQERIMQAFKDGPLAKQFEQFAPGQDFARGALGVELGLNEAYQSTFGGAAREKEAREALASLPDILPGTNAQGFLGRTVRVASEMLGQLPLVMNPLGAAVLGAATYGGTVAGARDAADAANDQADKLQKDNPQLAAQFRQVAQSMEQDARISGAISGTTMAFANQILPEAKSFWGTTARTAAEFGGLNAAQEALAAKYEGKPFDSLAVLDGILAGTVTGMVHGAGKSKPASETHPQPQATPPDAVLVPGAENAPETAPDASAPQPTPASGPSAQPQPAPESAQTASPSEPLTPEQVTSQVSELRSKGEELKNTPQTNPRAEGARRAIPSIEQALAMARTMNNPDAAKVLQDVLDAQKVKLGLRATQPEPTPSNETDHNANVPDQTDINPTEVTPGTEPPSQGGGSPPPTKEPSNAPQTISGNVSEHPGTPQGTAVPTNEEKVREEEGGQAGSGNRVLNPEGIPSEEGTQVAAEPSQPESPPSQVGSESQGGQGNNGGASGGGDSTSNAEGNPPLSPDQVRLTLADEESRRIAEGKAPLERISQGTVEDWNQLGLADFNAGKAPALVSSLIEKPRPRSPVEDATLKNYAGALDQKIKEAAGILSDPNAMDAQKAQAASDHATYSDERERVALAANLASSAWGAAGRGLQVALDRDKIPSLPQMVADLMTAKGKRTGQPFEELTPEEKQHLEDMHNQMQSTQDALDKARAEGSMKAVADQNAKLLEEARTELAATKKQLEDLQKSTASGGKKKPRFTQRTLESISAKAEEARKRLRERGVQFNALPDPSQLLDYAYIAAEYIAKGVDYAAEMVSKFGENIRDSLKEIGDKAQELLRSESRAKTVPELKAEFNARRESDPEAAIGQKFLRNIAKAHIREALETGTRLTADELDTKVWNDAKEFEPDITKVGARDLRTGYGKQTFPSDDPVEVELRDLNRQSQLLSSIERVEKGLAGLKSGRARDRATAEQRRLQKALNAEMAKHPELANSPENLATRRQGIVTRLNNEIEDLNNQIAGIQKADPFVRPVEYDEELTKLKDHRDALKKIVDEMPENKAASEREKNEAAIKAAQKAEAEWTRRANELDFSRTSKPADVRSKEVQEARAKAEEARKRYLDLKKSEMVNQPGDYFRAIESKMKASDQRIAELENKLARGDTSKKEAKPGESHPLLDEKRQQIADLNKKVEDMRRAQEAPNREAERLQNQLDDAQSKVIELEQRLMYGDLDKRPAVKREVDARLQSLREQVKGLNKAIEKSRSERERPQREAEAAARELQKAKDENADLEKRLMSGDLFKKKQEQRKVSDELQAERDRRKELNKQMDEARKQASLAYRPELPPKPTKEETRRKILKRNIEKRIAELRMKRIAQNYETPKRSDDLKKNDKELQKLELQKKKELGAYNYEKAQRELEAQPWYRKIARLPARAKRAIALISAPIYLKLAVAGNVARPFMTFMEETLGRGALRLFMPGVMKQAEGEGGASGMHAMADYARGWARGITEMKHTEFTGATRNQLLYGSKGERFSKPKWEDYLTSHPHAAIKAPAWEAAFSVSEGNRIAHAGYASADQVPEDKLTDMRRAAAKDADHAIYQNDNAINKFYSAALAAGERTGDVGAAIADLLRFENIIVKIPTNLVGEATKYLLGTAIAPVQKIVLKAKQGGALTPEQADSIARTFKKGSAFAGLVALAYFTPGAIKVGGQYVQGENRKKDDAKPGDVTIFGHEIPHVATHAGVFTAAQALGTGLRDMVKNHSITHAGAQVIMGLTEDIPMVRGTGEFLSSLGAGKEKEDARSRALKGLIPAPIRVAAEQQDYHGPHSLPYRILVDPDRANVTNRGSGFQSGIPDVGLGLPSRKDLPVKKSR